MLSAVERSQRYQERQHKAKRCIKCAEKNERWPKMLCTKCAEKQKAYYHRKGKFNRRRPSVRLLKFLTKKIKELETENRRLKQELIEYERIFGIRRERTGQTRQPGILQTN